MTASTLTPSPTGRAGLPRDSPDRPDHLTTNAWTGRSTVTVSIRPALAHPGEFVRLTVSGLPADAVAAWCHGGKLHGGADLGRPLIRRASGAWSTRFRLATYATAGAIRLMLFAASPAGIDRHDITGGAVRTSVLPPPIPPRVLGQDTLSLLVRRSP